MSDARSRLFQYLEAVVGVSVVLTLIVLVIEVRGNSLMIERQIRSERANNIVAPLLAQEELLSAYGKVKALDGWEPDFRDFMDHYGLAPAEAIVWSRMLLGIWWALEVDYLTTGASPELREQVRGLLAFPDNRLFWEHQGSFFDPGFQAFVEAQGESGPDPDRSGPGG
ncbi:MAG: hypothetical protein R3323_06285 [Wenzhouxiangellaceae bacterium]|nr:hypothetical protein [Wenzhouxiangellaceae bacterium]